MPRACITATTLIAVIAISVSLVACGSAGPSLAPPPAPSASPVPSAAPEPTPTLEATPMAAATPDAIKEAPQSADPNIFVSQVYKYALTLPPGSLLVGWHPAERAWNGQAKLETGGPYLDRAAVAEGGIHLYGAPSRSLDEWFKVVEGAGIRFHRCTEAQNRRDASIGGAQAIAFTQSCSNNIEIWDRVAIFKDGYGVGFWLHPTPGAEIAGRDRALELLEGLEWRTD